MKTAIVNAMLYDGTGAQPREADVLFQDDRIVAVENPGRLAHGADRIVDAHGLILAPGFIDAHSHSDTFAIKNPAAHAKITQGCTTEVVGQCGCSKCVEVMDGWDELNAYAKAVENARPAVNIATLVGHNSVRERVMGYENRAATPAEMAQMKAIIEDALAKGACGFSSGLWYLPGSFAPTEEIIELGECLRYTGKPYVTHMRSEGDGLLEAVDEAFAVAKNGSKRLQISHIKASPKQNWHKITPLLEKIAAARASGLTVFADRYPYIYSDTTLRMTLDAPWKDIPDIAAFLQDNDNADAVAKALDESHSPEDDWAKTIILDGDFAGKNILEAASLLNVTPGRTVVNILRAKPKTSAAFGKMSEDNMRTFISLPWVAAGSDASCYPPDFSLGQTHPRAFGTFPLFFRMACKTCTPEDVIRRMTSLPANIYNLRGRGAVIPGYIADLVLFDERTFQANSTFAEPHLLASGIVKVFVNGNLAFDADRPAEIQRHGRFLKVR